MDNKVVKSSEINIKIGLNEKLMPVRMDWNAEGAPVQECKAMLLSIFDKETKDTLKIDLWTTDMQVVEMDRFFYQTLRALGDTYFKATQNKNLAVDMQKFVQYFGEQTEILPKGE
jgi:gliding motility-associated protein GldC